MTTMMLSAKSRSYSSTSSSSSSSVGSRADDLYDRLLVKPQAIIDVWSAGNLRINGRDQSLPAAEAQELIATLEADCRFEMLAFTDFDGDDWKASYRLAPPTPPAQ